MPLTRIRKCTAGDFEAIYALLLQLWPGKELHKDILRNLYNQGLNSTNEEYYGVECDKRLVGFCSISFKNSLWQEGCLGNINELIIDQTLRKQGLGKDLLDAVFRGARQRGCFRVELASTLARVQASDFYLKMGFEKRASVFSKMLE
jgi:N-acetylglutamate synthase-like GNAT family acetyltransferase